jgi:hypothetical protein
MDACWNVANLPSAAEIAKNVRLGLRIVVKGFPFVAHRVISLLRRNRAAFGAKRTLGAGVIGGLARK